MLLWNKQESLTSCGCLNIIQNVRSVKTDTSYYFDIWRTQCWQAMCMPEAFCNVFDTYDLSSLNFLSIILKWPTFLALPQYKNSLKRNFLFQFWCAQYLLFQLEIWCRILGGTNEIAIREIIRILNFFVHSHNEPLISPQQNDQVNLNSQPANGALWLSNFKYTFRHDTALRWSFKHYDRRFKCSFQSRYSSNSLYLTKTFHSTQPVFALFRYEHESCRSFQVRTLNYVSTLLTSYFIKDTLLI